MYAYNALFAVRMVGFPQEEIDIIARTFVEEQGKGYGYFHLVDGNLQDPDLYIVNADEIRAMVTLADLTPSDMRPVLLIGTPNLELPYPCLPRPLQLGPMFEALDILVDKRGAALSRLEAFGVVTVPERRRRDRLHLDLTDPSEYERMRAKTPKGGILIVDKNPGFREYVANMLVRYDLPIAWANGASHAVEQCQQQNFAVVLVNTSLAGLDPYALSAEICAKSLVENTKVVLLVGKSFKYDQHRANEALVEGFMIKPIENHHLLSVLKKFMPTLSR